MLITLIGRLIQFVLMFASVKIMTHLLTPVEMGKVTLIMTTTSLFALFFVNPVGMFINRRMHTWVDTHRFRLYFWIFVLYLLGIAAIAAASLLAVERFGLDLGGAHMPWVIALVCGSLVFNTISTTLVPALNMLQRTIVFTMLTLGTLLASLSFSIWLNYVGTPSAERWLAGTLLGQALFGIIAYFVLFRGDASPRGEPLRINRQQWVAVASFCWPIGLAVLMQWTHMQGYRFLLADRFGLAQLGLYAAGYGLAASLISAFDSLLTTWYQPIFYRMVNSRNASERDQAWTTYAAIMVPASVLGITALVAASPSLPKVLLGGAFHDVGIYVLFGGLAEWGRMMVGLFGLNAHRHMSTQRLIAPNLIGAIATYLILLAFIAKLGLLAAPIGAFIGTITVISILWLHTYRDDPNLKLDWRSIAQWGGPAAVAACISALLQIRFTASIGSANAVIICFGIGLVWLGLAGLSWHKGLLKHGT
jgi:O-antigen/teichoic acid export membrane protein